LLHAKDGFFVPVVDLDLPSVEAALDQFPYWTAHIGRQQIPWLTVIEKGVQRHFIRDGSNGNQAQFPSAASVPPENRFDNFVADAASFKAKPDPAPKIPASWGLQDILRLKDLERILTAASLGRPKAQTCILAASRQQFDTLQRMFIKSTVTEASISRNSQYAIGCVLTI
jgi:hypothetical protein